MQPGLEVVVNPTWLGPATGLWRTIGHGKPWLPLPHAVPVFIRDLPEGLCHLAISSDKDGTACACPTGGRRAINDMRSLGRVPLTVSCTVTTKAAAVTDVQLTCFPCSRR